MRLFIRIIRFIHKAHYLDIYIFFLRIYLLSKTDFRNPHFIYIFFNKLSWLLIKFVTAVIGLQSIEKLYPPPFNKTFSNSFTEKFVERTNMNLSFIDIGIAIIAIVVSNSTKFCFLFGYIKIKVALAYLFTFRTPSCFLSEYL